MNPQPQQVWLWLALGGSLGALVRAGLVLLWFDQVWAIAIWATFLANLLGSLVLGYWAQFARHNMAQWPPLQAGLPAFCGGLTTFSGLTSDVFDWVLQGHWIPAFAWFTFSTLVSVASLALGWWFSMRIHAHRQLRPMP